MKEIPYHRPYPLNFKDKQTIHARLNEVLFTGQLTNGKYVRKLEGMIKEMYDVEYCIATSSCTQALILGLYFFQLDTMHEASISIPYFTWSSVQEACGITGYDGRLYFDIDPKTWLPIERRESYFPKNLKTIYLNTFGNVGKSGFEDRDVIYDSSHCLGATLQHKNALAHCISLAPTKLVTSCEGGLILTNHKDFYEYTKERRDRCCRMSELHAIIGLQTLTHLGEVLEWKELVYHYYNAHLEGQFQEIPDNSNYNTIGFINTEGYVIPEQIETRQYYEPIAYVPNSNAQKVYDNIICLPSWFGVDYEKIVEDIKNENNM